MSLRILHILNDSRGLDTFPSVYNSIYLWYRQGAVNYIASAGNCDEFSDYLAEHYRLGGTYIERSRTLSKLSSEFDIIITYEPIDLEIYILSKLWRKKSQHIHHSLEIPYLYFVGFNLKKLIHRILVRLSLYTVDMLIIQDAQREKLLNKILPSTNKIPCHYVPNSYISSIEPMTKSVCWFDKIKINTNKIVIYIGALEEWALPCELFDEIQSIQNTTFIFSGWCRTEGYLKKLENYCKDYSNITFKKGINKREELNYIVNNSDIGLAVYSSNEIDMNVKMIGMSSGKMHKYLSYNKPVVITELPVISNYLHKSKMGISFGNNLTLKDAITFVMDNYEEYVESIKKNYHSDCDYKNSYLKAIKNY